MSEKKHDDTVLNLMHEAWKCETAAQLYKIADRLEGYGAWQEAQAVDNMGDALAELEAEKRLRESLR